MATLREVFSSIANAIRSKTGKTDTIPPVDMATEIESIQAGGGDNKLAKLVDGTIKTITAEDLEGITEVRDYAFYRSSIENITLPDGIINIGNYACRFCSALTQITIPDSVTSLGNYAFDSCSSLKLINIPINVTIISTALFKNCASLTELTIPANVTSIGSGALRIGSTTNKATITMKPTTPPSINTDAFNTSYLNKIIVPAGCGDTYKSATNWSNLADYIEEATA